MGIPTALKQADARSQELARKQGMASVPQGAAPTVAQPPPQQQTAPPSQPEQRVAGLHVQDDQPPAAPKPETPPAPAVDAQAEAKYLALQGKYNAEVPKLHQDLRDMKARLDALEREKEELANKLKVAQQPVPEWANQIDDLGKSLGDENVAEVLHGLRNENQKLRQELNNRDLEFERLRSRVDGMESTAQHDTRMRQAQDSRSFMTELDRLVPDWKKINSDPAFVEYMYQPDPYARRMGRQDGATRQDILRERQAALDVEAVVAYYDEFKQLRQKGSDARQQALQQQMGPDDSGHGGTHLRSDKEIIPASFVTNFRREQRLGRWNNRAEEERRIDQAIFEAEREGRIDPRR